MKDISEILGQYKPTPPLQRALDIIDGACSLARKNGVYEKSETIRSMAVVLDSFIKHRQALDYAAALVNALEDKNIPPEDLSRYVMAFKKAAVGARMILPGVRANGDSKPMS